MGAEGEKDAWSGVLGATKGLMPEFERERVLDPRTTSPLNEDAIIASVKKDRPVDCCR
jgi:pyruvate dehydrogenase E1 component beta subunit